MFEKAVLKGIKVPVLCITAGKHSEIFANQSFRETFSDDAERVIEALIYTDCKEECISVESSGSIFLFSVSDVKGDQNEQVKVFSLIPNSQDMSARVESFHSNRLETLGLLSASIAHDFNNVLTGILGHVSYLRRLSPPPVFLESLVSVEDGAKRASSMTQEILNFSRLETGENKTVDLCKLTKSTCSLLKGAISPEYSLELNLPDKPIFVQGIESRIAQVIVNLVINARDALNKGGTIKVELIAPTDSGVTTQIKVIDDGSGMTKEVLDRAFEPYFSTKKERGTGLGLSTVLRIVEQIGGKVLVTSAPEHGTEVAITLPVSNITSEVGPDVFKKGDGAVKLQNGTGRILVVDDEMPVRNVLSLSLGHLGYSVEVASSGNEALEKFDNNGFDLVILDMLMPKLSGEDVFFKLKERMPHTRILLISGYTSPEVVTNLLKSGALAFIQKPFTIEELSKKVQECLSIK